MSNSAYTALYPAGNADSLDILAYGFSTDPANGSLVGQILVQSLSSGPGGTPELAGNADVWVIYFQYGGSTYYLMASYGLLGSTGGLTHPGAQTTESFEFGLVDLQGGETPVFSPRGTAAGVVDVNSNIVTIFAPGLAFNFPPGAQLDSSEAATYGRVGATSGFGYPVGVNDVHGENYAIGRDC